MSNSEQEYALAWLDRQLEREARAIEDFKAEQREDIRRRAAMVAHIRSQA